MIRNYWSGDIRQLAEIYNWYVVNTTATFDTEPISEAGMCDKIETVRQKFPCLVYEENGIVLGYAFAHLWKAKPAYSKTLETTIYIDHNHLRQGIGHKLMIELIDKCRLCGYRVLIACITQGNEGSIRMHETLGFTKVSHFDKVGEKFGRELSVEDFELIL
jgi:L-amino acid N-acyltransferase YncA